MSDLRRSLGDSSDEFSEGGSQTSSAESRKSVICYTERGLSYPAKLSLSSEESEEDSSCSDRNSQTQTPSRHQSSEFENEEFSLRARSSSSTNEDDPAISLLAELESCPQVASRYTEDDPEYAKELAARVVPPPVITQWAGRSRQQHGERGRGRGSHFDDRKRRFESEDNRHDRGEKISRREHPHNRYDQNQSNSRPSDYPSSSHSTDRHSTHYNQRR